jgi:hypothetical protein
MTTDTITYLPEEQLVQKALEALMTALGPVEATRFLSLSREGRLESVARHHQWQESLDRDTFFNEVFGGNEIE